MYLRKDRIFKIYISLPQLIYLLQRESFLSSLLLVELEPILNRVLSKPESLFYSSLSFIYLSSGCEILDPDSGIQDPKT